MEWWETGELDAVLWRKGQKQWKRWRKRKARTAYVWERFKALFSLSGNYSMSVRERAVWREVEAEMKRRTRKAKR